MRFFKAVKKHVVKVCAGVSALMVGLVVRATPVLAGISATDETAIKTGISTADVVFYSIGGSILLVLAGIWAFRLTKGLFGR